MTLLVIRHCEAGARLAGPEDFARPLTAEGREQAGRLVERLAGRPFARILSSPLRRCTESVEPLAANRQLRIELDSRLAPFEPAAAIELLSELQGQAVVLSTHGEVIVHLLRAAAGSGLDLGASPPMEKGSVWVLELRGASPGSASYLSPALGETGQGDSSDLADRDPHEPPG